jgi:hypothetical protein
MHAYMAGADGSSDDIDSATYVLINPSPLVYYYSTGHSSFSDADNICILFTYYLPKIFYFPLFLIRKIPARRPVHATMKLKSVG